MDEDIIIQEIGEIAINAIKRNLKDLAEGEETKQYFIQNESLLKAIISLSANITAEILSEYERFKSSQTV